MNYVSTHQKKCFLLKYNIGNLTNIFTVDHISVGLSQYLLLNRWTNKKMLL